MWFINLLVLSLIVSLIISVIALEINFVEILIRYAKGYTCLTVSSYCLVLILSYVSLSILVMIIRVLLFLLHFRIISIQTYLSGWICLRMYGFLLVWIRGSCFCYYCYCFDRFSFIVDKSQILSHSQLNL